VFSIIFLYGIMRFIESSLSLGLLGFTDIVLLVLSRNLIIVLRCYFYSPSISIILH